MDGVVNRKNIQKNSSQYDSHHARMHESFLYENEDQYHIFELGKPYRDRSAYEECFLGKNTCEQIDVRALLEEKDADHVITHASALPQELIHESVFSPTLYELNEDDLDHEGSQHVRFSFKDLPIFTHDSVLHSKHISKRFVMMAVSMIFFLSFLLFVGTAVIVKNRVTDASNRAILSMKSAMASLGESDLEALDDNIKTVYQEFLFASEEMDKISPAAIFISQFVPGASKLSSGSHIIEAGKYLSHTAKEFGSIIPMVTAENKTIVGKDAEHVSFLELYRLIADRMSNARFDIAQAQQHLDRVYIDDVPLEYRESFMQVKEILPDISNTLRTATESRVAVEDMLGANGPRTYLLLFQNNQEMRATGGFIGSYGIVKINKGRIEKMFVDDVFNPDGQLIDRVVPPLPIQKISANWSMHDSNWFTDFPLSAKKAMDFYERTGGPTVNGVIAITPAVMQQLLEITGPVDLPEYELTLTHENFVEVLQNEVEDRSNYSSETIEKNEQNITQAEDIKQPKKILSDLMPIMIDRLSHKDNPQGLSQVITAISDGIKGRHIVMYSSSEEIQEIIEESGWGGSVLDTDKDYLSVINTNINGFKTDGVVDEKIAHTAQIDNNGYIIDTVTIKRVHNGGHTGYPWWDAVNADYMRVYVPKGAQLISVEGHTPETNEQRLNYDALGYERDKDVVQEESQMRIDEETGTRIYDEFNKTVFANWVYVSPQESVTVTYKYRLPFRVDFYKDSKETFASYAVIFQKQSGSQNSSIESKVILDDVFTPQWHSHDNVDLVMKNDLDQDRYNGVVFRVRE